MLVHYLRWLVNSLRNLRGRLVNRLYLRSGLVNRLRCRLLIHSLGNLRSGLVYRLGHSRLLIDCSLLNRRLLVHCGHLWGVCHRGDRRRCRRHGVSCTDCWRLQRSKYCSTSITYGIVYVYCFVSGLRCSRSLLIYYRSGRIPALFALGVFVSSVFEEAFCTVNT